MIRILSLPAYETDLRRMVKQKHSNGKWIGITSGICPKCLYVLPLCAVFVCYGTIFARCLFFGFLADDCCGAGVRRPTYETLTAAIPSGKKRILSVAASLYFPGAAYSLRNRHAVRIYSLIFGGKYVGKREHVNEQE